MIDLDDLNAFKSIDPSNFLAHIDDLPAQVERAWALRQSLPALPVDWHTFSNIVLAGMGGSAIGGTLAQVLVAPECPLPISVLRDYSLPAFAGKNTLVIGSSHSGNTEETLSVCAAALGKGAKLLAITRGGQLAALAQEHGMPVWRFEHEGQPRAAVGYSFMLTLAALERLGLAGNKSTAVAEAVKAMRAQQASLRAEGPVIKNPAKRLAGQIMGRLAAVFASDYLAPVARRWKGQLAEVSKAAALFDELPEMDHNAVVGTLFPEPLVSKFMVLFLRSSHAHPRNRRRSEVTREIYLTAGFNTDVVEATGESPLAHMLTTLHYGDYAAYYLAMCYGVDPTPIPQIDYLKEQLGKN